MKGSAALDKELIQDLMLLSPEGLSLFVLRIAALESQGTPALPSALPVASA